jgi:hypothetical protein
MAQQGDPFQAMVAALRSEAGGREGLPPVHLWNPTHCGTDDFEIRADGSWRHEGSPIGRAALVKLFASILRKDDDGETYLVTPAEKVRVRVEDAPFVAVRVDRIGAGREQRIAATTNVGDVTEIGPDRPLRVIEDEAGAPRPYVLVRGRLEARVLRAPFYELVAWGETGPDGRFGVWSGGAFFPLEPVAR